MKIELSEIDFARLVDRLFGVGWKYGSEKRMLLWHYTDLFLKDEISRNNYKKIIENRIGRIILYNEQYKKFKAILDGNRFILKNEN